MKLRVRVCPNKCSAHVQPQIRGRVFQARMNIVSSMIERPQGKASISEGVDYTKSWILDYKCPVCGTTIPITADDIFLSSRRPMYYGTSHKRQRDRKADERDAQTEAENK